MATARILYLIYFVMSLIELVFLLIGRMPFLEALMITFGTAGTGGFGVRNSSIGGYSAYIQWVVAIFMLLFGMNFNFYYFILLKRAKAAFKMEEIRAYLAMVAAACVMIFVNLQHQMQGMEGILRHTFFQVASLTTSTGFATVDFDRWPGFSKMVLIFLMFVGACAGSTGGGLKVQRILILLKSFTRQMRMFVHPRSVRRIKYDGKSISDEMASSVQTYLIAFLIVFGVSLMLISLEGKDAVTNFTSVLTTINNMGPGLNLVGPAKNFEHMSVLSKYVLMFDMLAGRLELYPLLMLMNPLLWKETAQKQARIRRRIDR
jgi:trk system potassium uptake protein TrkH